MSTQRRNNKRKQAIERLSKEYAKLGFIFKRQSGAKLVFKHSETKKTLRVDFVY